MTTKKHAPTPPKHISALTEAIVTVGDGGRGFLIAFRRETAIITAAHCLPHLPPAHGGSYTEERTYANLVGPIGAAPSVWVECLFVNPIVDLAVLVAPDRQELSDQDDAYEQFVEGRPTIALARASQDAEAGWLYGKTKLWEPCSVSSVRSRLIRVENTVFTAMAPGTSGSPILTAEGRAVGVVTLGREGNPELASDLPAWLVAELFANRVAQQR